MSRRIVDAVVVGAGPAASAFACRFARGGKKTLLLERGEPRRTVVCGGFLGPEAREAFRVAGLEDELERLSKNPIRQARISRQDSAEIAAPLAGRAYAVDRARLDSMLLDRALEAGAECAFQTILLEAARFAGGWNLVLGGPRDVCEVTAKYFIRACGRRAPQASGREAVSFACKTVYDAPLIARDTVFLHFVRGGHVGINPLGDGRVTLCLHIDGAYLKQAAGDLDAMMVSLSSQNRSLATALSAARRIEEWKTCPAEPDFKQVFSEQGAFCIGDAVTMIHPVIGGGVPVAVESAAILAETLLSGDPDPLGVYRGRWKRRFSVRAAAAEWLARAEHSEVAAPLVYGVLEKMPVLLRGIVAGSRA